MDLTSTPQRRLVFALAVTEFFALLVIVGSVHADGPAWAKTAEAAVVVVVAGAGALIAAVRGTTGRRFLATVVLVIVLELVALNIFINAACYLGGCGD